jgi:hypothetical protein
MKIEKELQMSEFKSWEEMTALEQAQCTYSDFHKDAYGFRPRNDVSDWTLEDFDREFAIFARVCEENRIQQEAAEAEATAKFEQHVTNTICMGAKDRATALRWIMDASQADGDWEYFCFLNGLPYGYFREMEVA